MPLLEPGHSPAHSVPAHRDDRPLVVSASRGINDLDAEALSAAVATEVMGWGCDGEQWLRPKHPEATDSEQTAAPIFATDPREASLALRHILTDGWHCTIQVQAGTVNHAVTLWRRPHDRISSEGDSMAQAACRAMLELSRSRWRSRPPSLA